MPLGVPHASCHVRSGDWGHSAIALVLGQLLARSGGFPERSADLLSVTLPLAVSVHPTSASRRSTDHQPDPKSKPDEQKPGPELSRIFRGFPFHHWYRVGLRGNNWASNNRTEGHRE